MDDRGEQQACDHQEREPRVQRIETGEQLAPVGLWIVDGAHAAEQHCRIQEGVSPQQVLVALVAPHPDQQRQHNENRCDREVARHPQSEVPSRQRAHATMFVHGSWLSAG